MKREYAQEEEHAVCPKKTRQAGMVRTDLDVDLIFKIAAVGILVAVLNILLSRSGRDDQALMTSIAGLVVVLVVVVREISSLFELIRELFGF